MISPSAGYHTSFKVWAAECERAVQKKSTTFEVHCSLQCPPPMYSILFYSIPAVWNHSLN